MLRDWCFVELIRVRKHLGFRVIGKLVAHSKIDASSIGENWNTSEVRGIYSDSVVVSDNMTLYRLGGLHRLTCTMLNRALQTSCSLSARRCGLPMLTWCSMRCPSSSPISQRQLFSLDLHSVRDVHQLCSAKSR